MLKKITVVAIILSSLLVVKNAFNNATTPIAGYSGAPGDQTCAASGCHVGVTKFRDPILGFKINTPANATVYTTNTPYVFLVNFPLSTPGAGGFLVSALDDNNNNAGTLEIISASTTDTISSIINGRKYIGHKGTGNSAWLFRWRSPSSYVGKVTFYCAALFGDGNTQVTNDVTYLDTIQLLAGGVSNILDANFNSSRNTACVNDVVTFTNTSTGTITTYNWDFGAGATPPTANTAGPHNVAYSTPGTKNIKLKISDGTDSDSIVNTITVNAFPVASAGQNVTICSGTSTTLTATGGGTYVWSNGATTASTTVAPVANTNYTVTVTQNGCSSTAQVAVNVVAAPVLNLSNTTLCSGNSIILNAANAGATYLWSTNATTQTINVTTGGTYSVTVTNANNCTVAASAVVTPVSSLTVGLPDTVKICAGQTATLNAGNAGANFAWSTNATTQSINVQAQGSYRVTVTDQNGCVGRDTAFVKVNANPVVNINDDAICNGQTISLDAGNAGATFAWSNQATAQSIIVSPGNTTTYSVTVTNAANCSATDNATITVSGIRADDVVVCNGDSATLTALGGTDYVWSNGATTATIKVFTLDTISLTVTGTVVGNCNNTDEVFIYPVSAVTPTFTFPDTFCSNINNVLLDDFVNPAGGTFTGPGVTGNLFNASNVLPGGPFNIAYNYADNNGCGATVNQQFWVIVAPTVDLANLNAEYCTNENLVQLQGLPQGGTFSGAGVADNLFIPFFAEAGTHYISYSFTAANGCFAEDIDTVIVHEVPQIVFFMPQTTFCENDSAIVLNGIPSGGVFSGAGVTDSIFTPLQAGVGGNYAIQYAYTDTNNCTATAANIIRVNDSPELSFSGLLSTYCVNELAVPLNALPAGGVFTGNGVANNLLVPSVAGVGDDTIAYTYINSANCATTINAIVTIADTPQVTFTGLDTAYCSNEPSVTLNGIPSGGTYSGDGVVGNLFNPALTGIGGPFTVNYSYTDNNGCKNSKSQLVFVNESPVVSVSGLINRYCVADEANYDIVLLPQGGSLTGAGIIGQIFNPSLAGEGTHIIRYEFLSANGCYDSEDVVVEVVNCNSVTDLSLGKVTVYPNPFSNNFTVAVENTNLNDVQVNLYNTLGSKVNIEVTISNNVMEIKPLSELSNGLYIINIVSASGAVNSSIQKF